MEQISPGLLICTSTGNDLEDEQVRYRLRKVGVLLRGLLQSGLCLFGPAEMKLSHSLSDKSPHRCC